MHCSQLLLRLGLDLLVFHFSDLGLLGLYVLSLLDDLILKLLDLDQHLVPLLLLEDLFGLDLLIHLLAILLPLFQIHLLRLDLLLQLCLALLLLLNYLVQVRDLLLQQLRLLLCVVALCLLLGLLRLVGELNLQL